MTSARGIRVTSEVRRVIALDTNILIYHLEENPSFVDFTTHLFDRIECGKLHAVVSALALHEILAGVNKAGFAERGPQISNLILSFPNLAVVPFDAEMAVVSGSLRARYGLRTPDAIHAATAIRRGADAFVTNDDGFRKVRELKVRMPGDRIP